MRIVLADDDQERGDAIAAGLRAAGMTDIARLALGETLVAVVRARSADVVILALSRPDRDSLDIIRTLSREAPRPVAVFVDRDDPPFMEAAIAAGVSSYNVMDNVVGGTRPDLAPVIRATVAIFRRYRRLEEDFAAADAKLGERAIIHRAKLHLKAERGLSEPAAHRWLRRAAMNRGKRMVDIASELLAKLEEATALEKPKAAENKVDPGAA